MYQTSASHPGQADVVPYHITKVDITLLPVNAVKIVSGGKGRMHSFKMLSLPEKGAAAKCRRIDNFVKLPVAL